MPKRSWTINDIRDEVHKYLQANGAKAVKDIATALGYTIGQITTVLYEGNGGGAAFFQKHGRGGRYYPHTWTAI